MTKQYDLFGGKEAKQDALDRVWDNSVPWNVRALEALSDYPHHYATGEDIRLWLIGEIGHPHHHNAWGALISNGVRRKMLVPTGKWLPMKVKTSHARKTPQYEVNP